MNEKKTLDKAVIFDWYFDTKLPSAKCMRGVAFFYVNSFIKSSIINEKITLDKAVFLIGISTLNYQVQVYQRICFFYVNSFIYGSWT